MNQITVLLVEDSKPVAAKISLELEAAGYSVVDVIETGEQAIENIPRLNPDVVLMDITLKGKMNGIEATKIIKNNYHIPIIILSMHLSDALISKAVSSDADGYLSKLSSFKEINAAIMMVIKKYKTKIEQDAIIKDKLSRSVILAETNMRIIMVMNAIERIRVEELKFHQSNNIKSFYKYILKELTDLTSAEYGALALFNKSGGLDEFITIGLPDEIEKPAGGSLDDNGLLNIILQNNGVVQLDDLDDDSKNISFPAGYPVVKSLLGSSITINDVTRAAIYLTNKKHKNKNYTESDELVLSLFISEVKHTLERNDLLSSLQAEKIALRDQRDSQQKLIQKISEMQDQLIQSEKMASIGQLAAGVAHEINNPIGYVSSNLGSLEKYINNLIDVIDVYVRHEDVLNGNAEALNDVLEIKKLVDIEYTKQDVLDLLSESNEGINRVRKIVQDLKDFSHVDESEWQWANLNEGISSTINIVNNEIKYKAEVVKELGDIPEIECMASQLNQVFMNLLVNAAQSINERGVITIRTGVNNNDWVYVEIQDTGAGIKEENLTNIFNPFFTTKPVGKGTGLGLSLSYSIIQNHCGKIDVQSKEGEGTKFIVHLPVHHSELKAETG